MTVAVVIPAYNEAATIADIVRRARQQVDWVMVVDDGSGDDSAARAEAAGATVLRQLENQGKGASLWRGMRHAIERGAEAVIPWTPTASIVRRIFPSCWPRTGAIPSA